jgi:hypothetical protein
MKEMTNEQLSELGWEYVARDENGKVVGMTVGDDPDVLDSIIEWIDRGLAVYRLSDPSPRNGEALK